MRFLVIVHIPTEAGNKAMKDPNFIQKFEDYFNSVKPEAVYFGEDDGERTVYMVLDIGSADMMVTVAEPLFNLVNARVDIEPVMVLEDIKKGMQALQK
ncbi:hypothetical protein [[Eubacterium] cellulosolvens]